jgi:hypothetical protein
LRTFSVDTLGAREVALRVGTLVDVLAGGNVDELFVRSTRDNVGTNQAITFVTPNRCTIRVVVWSIFILDDSVLNVREVEALHPGAGGYAAAPSAITLAEKGWETWTLVSGVTFIPDDCSIVKSLAGQLVRGSMVDLREGRTLRGLAVRKRTPAAIFKAGDGLQWVSTGERESGIALVERNTREGDIRSFDCEPVIYLRHRTAVHCLTNRYVLTVPATSSQTTDTDISYTCGEYLTGRAGKIYNWAECSIPTGGDCAGSGDDIRTIGRIDGRKSYTTLGRVRDEPDVEFSSLCGEG